MIPGRWYSYLSINHTCKNATSMRWPPIHFQQIFTPMCNSKPFTRIPNLILSHKRIAIYVDKKNLKNPTYFKRQCRWCASSDIEQIFGQNIYKNNEFDDDLRCMMISRNMKKTKFKIMKVMKFMLKTISSHLLLSIP